ncbi:MAG: hypothetical protein HC768_08410 [Acaryochloris sp. CRU_2_0]|nr:hypothetical protein [Acaryochloris sp. CRU_2_0]
MNQKTLDFIKNHWQILIDPAAKRFADVIDASPLACVAVIATELQHQGTLTIQELAERTRLNENTIAQVTRVLEGKLFERVQNVKPILAGSHRCNSRHPLSHPCQ